MKNGRVLLGVTGSIAAYKAADLVSALVKIPFDVHVMMTEEATQLIRPLTLQTLSRNKVHWDIWASSHDWEPDHIQLADSADLFVVAPATAHTIACFANGLAPDLLTTTYLAVRAPVLIAPAMNGNMLSHPATVKNLETLRSRGHRIIEPAEGMLACGYEGKGKLAPVESLLAVIKASMEEVG